jgi:tetratricopeptide (TPR) repeat protein
MQPVEALRAGDKAKARDLLTKLLKTDQKNALYWIWLSAAVESTKERIYCLQTALQLNPENASIEFDLAVFYALLGRDQEARAALEAVGKKLLVAVRLNWIMFGYPFRDRAVADRYVEGLLKAGVSVQPPGYVPVLKENQLTGEEIRALLFDSTITGTRFMGIPFSLQWWIDFKKNGDNF